MSTVIFVVIVTSFFFVESFFFCYDFQNYTFNSFKGKGQNKKQLRIFEKTIMFV